MTFKYIRSLVITITVFAAFSSSAKQDAAIVLADAYNVKTPIYLYPEGEPSLDGWAGKINKKVIEKTESNGEFIFNVTKPTLTAYLPTAERNTGTAVLIAPGGGFRLLSIHSEGTRVAKWLAERGIAAFVLKYRVVQLAETTVKTPIGEIPNMMGRRDEFPMSVAGKPAIEDGFRALDIIRKNADKYAIDASKVVAIGFSAGANLVSNLGLANDINVRPNYVAAIYGSPKFQETLPSFPLAKSDNALPPFFITLAQNDALVGNDVRNFYNELLASGYLPEAHFYINGDHGFGMKNQGTTSDHFIDQFYWWLQTQGLTRKPGEPIHKVAKPFDLSSLKKEK